MSGTQVISESPFPEITYPQQRAFLAAFRETGNVRLACEVAKVGRSSYTRWLEKDPGYREAFDLAKEEAADILEAGSSKSKDPERRTNTRSPGR